MIPRASRSRSTAFTLIEMLVVISIIVILMALAFPAFQSVQNSAKKTQAKNDLVQIVTAVNAFYTEYGKYPLPSTASGDGPIFGGSGSASHKPILDALRGVETGSSPLNTRQIVFISPPDSKDQTNGRAGVLTSDGQFYDPWGSAYRIAIDADYDNQVPNPYGASGGAGPAEIRQGAIAFSVGKNGALGGGSATNNKFGAEGGSPNVFTGSGDVISWQ